MWGDVPDSQARASLRQTLSLLGKALGDAPTPCLVIEGRAVAVASGAIDVDVARFEAAVAEGTAEALERAAPLYRGDLLDSDLGPVTPPLSAIGRVILEGMVARHDPQRPVGQITGHPVQEVVAALGAHLGDSLRGVVLFGSRARGDARPESDWDLLVVADGLPASLLERSRILRSALPARWCGRAAIMAKTPHEFQAEFPAYYLDIATDGRILHDSDGYLEDRLNRIRQRMREAGLQRRTLDHGFVWVWQTPPRGPWRIDWGGVHGLGVGR